MSPSGETVPLRPKAFATLALLVERAPALITKDEILDVVWEGAVVSDTVLKVCIRELRRALGDDPRTPRYIETRHRIGYRLVAPLSSSDDVRAAPRARTELRSTDEGSLGWFVGRRAQLDRLGELLELVVRGARGPRLVLVEGDAGLGKTSLVRAAVEAARSREGLVRLWGECVARHELVEPLGPVLESVGDAATGEPRVRSALARCAPTWCRELPAVFGDGERASTQPAPPTTSARMLREIGDVIRDLSEQAPIVWAVEDLHWADPSTVDLLTHLARRCAGARLLVVATARPSSGSALAASAGELVAGGFAERMELRPFDGAEIEELVTRTIGAHRLDRAWIASFDARTEGHPLFAARLLEHLLGTGALVRDDDGSVVLARGADAALDSVPRTVESMVEQKLAALDGATAELLGDASAQGSTFALDPLELDDDGWARAERLLDAASVRHQLVRRSEERGPDGAPAARYRFAHALFRDALYRRLATTRRARLHRAIASWLRARHAAQLGPHAATIAHHYAECGAVGDALAFVERAAEHAEQCAAPALVESACERGLALSVLLADERERDAVRVRFHRRRAELRIGTGRFGEASDDLVRMRQAAEATGDLRALHDAHMLRFRQAGYLGRWDEATASAREAESLARARGDDVAIAEVRCSIASLQGVRGELAEAADSLADAMGALPPEAAPPLRYDLASYLAMRGEYAAAERELSTALPWAEARGDSLRVPGSLFWLALASLNRGHAADALSYLDRARRRSEHEDEDMFVLPRVLAAIGSAHRAFGCAADARTWSERALEASERGGPIDGRCHALLGLALDRASLGLDASAHLDDVEALGGRPFFSDWLVVTRVAGARARIAACAGELALAERWAGAWLERARGHGLRKHAARAGLLLALVAHAEGDDERAERSLAAVSDVLTSHPMPLVEWRVEALRVARGADPATLRSRIAALCANAPPPLAASLEQRMGSALRADPLELAGRLA